MSTPTITLRTRRPVLLVAALMALVVGACAACSGPTPEVQEPCPIPSQAQDVPEPDADDPARPAIAVEIDGTGSMRERRDELAEAVHAVVARAVEDEARLSIGTFGATRSSAAPLDCVDDLVLVPFGNNDAVRDRSRERLVDEVTDLAMEAFDARGLDEQTDPMAALLSGRDDLARISEGGRDRLVILSDFEPSTGCLVPEDGTAPSVDGLVAGCDDIPSLDGVSVSLAGAGRSDPPPPTEHVQWWIDVAEAMCEATGAADCAATGSHLPELPGR